MKFSEKKESDQNTSSKRNEAAEELDHFDDFSDDSLRKPGVRSDLKRTQVVERLRISSLRKKDHRGSEVEVDGAGSGLCFDELQIAAGRPKASSFNNAIRPRVPMAPKTLRDTMGSRE